MAAELVMLMFVNLGAVRSNFQGAVFLYKAAKLPEFQVIYRASAGIAKNFEGYVHVYLWPS